MIQTAKNNKLSFENICFTHSFDPLNHYCEIQFRFSFEIVSVN